MTDVEIKAHYKFVNSVQAEQALRSDQFTYLTYKLCCFSVTMLNINPQVQYIDFTCITRPHVSYLSLPMCEHLSVVAVEGITLHLVVTVHHCIQVWIALQNV